MLDVGTEAIIAKVTEQIRHSFGAELVAIVLYGSAAGDDFVAGRSNVNLVIVVERLTFNHLKPLHQLLPKWHKLGVATPLLLDRDALRRARDVFPMEFCDIKAQHRVLFGEEVFARLEIDRRYLRYQSEYEARSKLMRLRALYAEVGADAARLESLMLDSVKTFAIIMRSFIRVRSGGGQHGYLEVLAEFEAHFDARFPVIGQLLRIKLAGGTWDKDREATFQAYLEEVERLVDLVDRLLPDAEASHP